MWGLEVALGNTIIHFLTDLTHPCDTAPQRSAVFKLPRPSFRLSTAFPFLLQVLIHDFKNEWSIIGTGRSKRNLYAFIEDRLYAHAEKNYKIK